MKLTGVVTSVHSGSQYTDKQRRVTITIDKEESEYTTTSFTRVDDKLQFEDRVAIVIVGADGQAREQVA